MRKVFIDCGAHKGESLEAFSSLYADSGEYEAYCFEISDSRTFKQAGLKTMSRLVLEKNIKSAVWDTKAVWIKDGTITWYDDKDEGSSVIKDKYAHNPKGVECFDLSKWIKSNFTKKDHIVLKIDIEGAEYEVLQKLYDDGTLKYVDKLYCEIHGSKCGKSLAQSLDLICRAKDLGHHIYVWSAASMSLLGERIYDQRALEREYKKWDYRKMTEIVTWKEKCETGMIDDREQDIIKTMATQGITQQDVIQPVHLSGDMLTLKIRYDIIGFDPVTNETLWKKKVLHMELENESLKQLAARASVYSVVAKD